MKVSMHCGRCGRAEHNDRSFMEKEREREDDGHIDSSRSNQNWSQSWNGKAFEQAELDFYEKNYRKSLDWTNENYKRNGHPERCRTMYQMLHSKRYCPEEMILQIGKSGDTVSKSELLACVKDYVEIINSLYGENLHVLDISFHLDETTPHVHIRRVWDYETPDGIRKIGQEKSLEAMGISLPDPSKKPGRYNSRKMTFDKECRRTWQDVCKRHGLFIETEPPSKKTEHLPMLEYKVSQEEKKLESLESQLQNLEALKQQKLLELQSIQSRWDEVPDFVKDQYKRRARTTHTINRDNRDIFER